MRTSLDKGNHGLNNYIDALWQRLIHNLPYYNVYMLSRTLQSEKYIIKYSYKYSTKTSETIIIPLRLFNK
jgi:hypothetical protein